MRGRRIRSQGFLLYSLGPDGEDDDGRDWRQDDELNREDDDIAVRVPPLVRE